MQTIRERKTAIGVSVAVLALMAIFGQWIRVQSTERIRLSQDQEVTLAHEQRERGGTDSNFLGSHKGPSEASSSPSRAMGANGPDNGQNQSTETDKHTNQPHVSPGEQQQHAQDREKMEQTLNLTTAQKQQVQDVIRNTKSQMDQIRQDTTMPRERQQEERQRLRSEQSTQIKSFLSPDQQARYDSYEQQQSRNREGGKGR